jgi:hypothetical protein
MASKSKSEPDSQGVRRRLGYPVRDARLKEDLSLPLLRREIERAKKQRGEYDVDDPANFSACTLAICLGKAAGAEVQIGRRYAWVHLPGAKFTLRYQLSPETAEIVRMNDRGNFEDIPENVVVHLVPPTPGRRLAYERARPYRKSHTSRGVRPNPPRPADPWRGVYRNAVHAPSEMEVSR